jgi:hypothetical protein
MIFPLLEIEFLGFAVSLPAKCLSLQQGRGVFSPVGLTDVFLVVDPIRVKASAFDQS